MDQSRDPEDLEEKKSKQDSIAEKPIEGQIV
jgi:hypothetical protein